MPKNRKGKKVNYHLRNWPLYNKALVHRGQLIFMIIDNIHEFWLENPRKEKLPGGQPLFTDKAIEICLQIRFCMKSPLRQTQGFIEGLFDYCGIDLPVPNYTLLSKRAKDLNITIRKFKRSEKIDLNSETKRLTIDSTGLKIYGEGEWANEKHKTKIKRQWMKAHLGIAKNGDVLAAELTSNSVGDAPVASILISRINTQIDEFQGDGAYDSNPLHEELEAKWPGIKIITSPRTDAVLSPNAARDSTQRDLHILKIQEKGRDAWQAISGYNKRNLIENTMYRYKTIFGGKL
ncbi:MAG TPA: IS5 family transposase, partial [Victivallales bacterium]|nr:IS5 family transposase [Victivallales bacterium]